MTNLRKVQSQLNEIGSFCSKIQLREMLQWWLLYFSIMGYLFIAFTLQTYKYKLVEIYEGNYLDSFNLLTNINSNLYFIYIYTFWHMKMSFFIFADKYFLYIFRSPTGVPKIHQKTDRLSWQRGNSQPSLPRSCNCAYVSESLFFFIFAQHTTHTN